MSEEDRGPTRRDFLEASVAALGGLAFNPATQASATAAVQSAGAAARGGVDLPSLTIAEAGQRIASRQLSPVELIQGFLARAEDLNPRVGAFITITAEHAMDAARNAEREIMQGNYRGPLHGIPYGVKDTFYARGIRTTAGSFVLRDFHPDFDATIVRRLNEAGAILVGKLNLPEMSFGGRTPGCRNPWDLSRNAGGSSGGSGAALAASMLLAATGGDTSGSIRNPASTCGVVGHKPTFGLVSRYGVVPISWTLDHLGPMARNVEDTAILLRTIAGPDPNDRFNASVTADDYPQLLGRSIRSLRIGVLAESEMEHFHPDTRRAFMDAVRVLEGQGAEIREVTFSEQTKTAASSHGIIRISEAATYHRHSLRTRAGEFRHIWSSDPADANASNTRTTLEAGMLLAASQYLKAQQARSLFLEEVRRTYATLDVFLDPTMPAPADVPAGGAQSFRNWFNLSGYPAVSVPCGFSTDPPGLPIGLQISAKPFQDALALAVAHAYESSTDWHRRRPVL
jgi:aspartyl-tRNA(Asn)/glutamyl-tRNA(Gln) amidotransferase subunit A